MNRYITTSIFLAAGLSSLVASATNITTGMKGSDTLFDLTRIVIPNCPNAVAAGMTAATYIGTGSGAGEGAMEPASGTTNQTIAPMSRFLNGGAGKAVCQTQGITANANGGGTVTFTQAQVEAQACGMVVGLDGVSVLGSMYTAGSVACDGPGDVTQGGAYPPAVAGDCAAGTDPAGTSAGLGLAHSTNITWTAGNSPTYGPALPVKKAQLHAYAAGTYTFQDWTDVLRIIYAGFDKFGCQDCESDARNGIVEHWGNIFEDGNANTTNCNNASGTPCTALRHAWRRDSESGTTDTFLSLLGLPSVTRDANNVASADPFCNFAGRTGANIPACLNNYMPDFADQDSIRRVCASTNDDSGNGAPAVTPTEQVCGRDGKLGVVIPIVATDEIVGGAPVVYPTSLCTTNEGFGTAPPGTTSGKGSDGRCPNGDIQIFGNQCLIPVDASGNANCMASKDTAPSAVFDPSTTLCDAMGHGGADARVYGLHAYTGTAAGGIGYLKDTTPTKRPVVGLFTRIHTSRSMNSVNAALATCTNLNATDQIGCLVQADECSLGFAGNSAENIVATGYPSNCKTADALLVNGVAPTDTNIQNNFFYPLSRKLYLNSMIGFNNVWGGELELAKCEAAPSMAGFLTTIGFTPIGAPGGSGTYMEDYNEQMLCGAAQNTPGCTPTAVGLAANTLVTTCGNGIQEPYEDCDLGATVNGTAGAACTATCRTAHIYAKPTGCTTCPCLPFS